MKRFIVISLMIAVAFALTPGYVFSGEVKSEVAPKVNINSATADELVVLEGITSESAESIIKYRMTNGPFKNLDELSKVKGIDVELIKSIKEKVIVE
ncbi:MAG: helix-hairpin-helix domain-containing protein [Thermodesulfobacteriota bacterium]|nr:helix-hairpin-helix domain-containing protein [Thermodesulfobacteriota bacterium]